MATEKHLNDMRTTVLEFIADLKDNVLTSDSDQGDLVLVEFFFKRMHPLMLMQHIIKNVLPHHEKIEQRDVSFFIDQKDKIFAGLDSQKVDYFAELCSSQSEEGIGADNREVIWQYFDVMVGIAKNYKNGLKTE